MEPNHLDPERCYRALCGRDARFDGRFYTGVKTTGIFCRPICPAPTPKPANCSYWPSAAAAQAAGFRPCLRCRPESAPGTPAWRGTAASVSRALRLIEAGALDDGGSVDELAERLGIGARHLRRLFDRHLGATPRAVAKLRRVLFAKQLIDETRLPMTEIALSAGFASQRRFNACIREVYGRPPSALRRTRGGGPERDGLELSLSYREPFDWPALLGFFRERAIPGVEVVSADRYLRTIRTLTGPGSIAVAPDAGRRRLRVTLRLPTTSGLIDVSAALRRLFDLDADGETIDGLLAGCLGLRSHIRQRPGLRVPGAFDGFETAVRAILGQQVSVKAASTVAGRVAERWGRPLPRRLAQDVALTHAFPTARRLARAELEQVGILPARAETIRGLARAVLRDPTLLEPGEDAARDLARWTALPGIGPWTAQYVAMRLLREPDALPASDLGLRKAITPVGAPLRSAKEVERVLEGCRPYRAYAAMRLWSGALAGGGG